MLGGLCSSGPFSVICQWSRTDLEKCLPSSEYGVINIPGLVIKPVDKGSGRCLMGTSLYISKIEEHLSDPSIYKELSSDPTQAIRDDVLSTLD